LSPRRRFLVDAPEARDFLRLFMAPGTQHSVFLEKRPPRLERL